MEDVDVCIIGGGIAGASVAFRVAPVARVLLLEREPHPGYHSTGRSAALFHPQYGSPVIRALTGGRHDPQLVPACNASPMSAVVRRF